MDMNGKANSEEGRHFFHGGVTMNHTFWCWTHSCCWVFLLVRSSQTGQMLLKILYLSFPVWDRESFHKRTHSRPPCFKWICKIPFKNTACMCLQTSLYTYKHGQAFKTHLDKHLSVFRYILNASITFFYGRCSLGFLSSFCKFSHCGVIEGLLPKYKLLNC